MVISEAGRPPAESGNSTRRDVGLSLVMPLRTGSRAVSKPARLGVHTEAAE
jgi:hypothetical protein